MTTKSVRLTPLPETDPNRSDFECGCVWYYATAESDAAMWVCPDHRHPMAYDAMREALRECVEFLDHSGNQRSVLSGKFATPSARYDWFQRVRTNTHAALAAAEGKVEWRRYRVPTCLMCQRDSDDGPAHDPAPDCESGSREHCTCDTCF